MISVFADILYMVFQSLIICWGSPKYPSNIRSSMANRVRCRGLSSVYPYILMVLSSTLSDLTCIPHGNIDKPWTEYTEVAQFSFF